MKAEQYMTIAIALAERGFLPVVPKEDEDVGTVKLLRWNDGMTEDQMAEQAREAEVVALMCAVQDGIHDIKMVWKPVTNDVWLREAVKMFESYGIPESECRSMLVSNMRSRGAIV